MHLSRLTCRFALFVAAAVPFTAIAGISAWSVGPLGQTGARWCNLLVAGLSPNAERSTAPAAPEESSPIEPNGSPSDQPARTPSEAHALNPLGQHPHYQRTGAAGPLATRRGASTRRARPGVFVGPESIKRAIPTAGRPTSTWTNRTPEHPAGLLIQSPGALAGVIEPGDILVEAEGQALGSFEQLLVTVKEAYERRVNRLSGRLFRKGDLLPVTVEPGW